MITFLYVVYVMICLFLILVVLLQAGRGGMGAAFGGSSQTVFGGSGAGNFLTRLTVISAALFMMLSATLTYVSSSGEKSLEKATERVRMREEARSEVAKDAKGEKKPGDKAATGDTEAPTSNPDNPAVAPGAEQDPAPGLEEVEGAPAAEGAAEPQGKPEEKAPASPSGNP
jgi:preprotein translocase subunit SecG